MTEVEPDWLGLNPPPVRSSYASPAGFVAAWVEWAGTPFDRSGRGEFELLAWEIQLLHELFDDLDPDGFRVVRQSLTGLPRKNGKSVFAALLALYMALADDEDQPQVFCVAKDRSQASVVFDWCKRIISRNRALATLVDVQRWAILVRNDDPDTDVPAGVIRPLSRDPKTAEGLEPHCVIFDEVHVQPNRELWDVVNLGSATRRQPLIIGITTAGTMTGDDGADSLCFTLYQYGLALEKGELEANPAFHFTWYSAPETADWLDPAVWRAANPAFGVLQHETDFASVAKTTPENEFRTKRLNQWVNSNTAWLPTGTWAALTDSDRHVADDEPLVLAFDGSRSRDSTALVAATIEPEPHVFVIGLWERPPNAANDWQIPSGEVFETLEHALTWRNVVELCHDPAYWRERFDAIAALHPEQVVAFPNTTARMVPATQALRARVLERRLTHDGNPNLERHVRNALAKMTPQGVVVAKDGRDSPRKIDALVATIMAVERAAWHAANPAADTLGPTVL